uniref:uncharacterized protein LOC127061979 n=1 Tax=Vespula vulgaris TaxID=7454 RepID=UPI00223A9B59|nr:uncharacterized protein LOC127061979 [Vespula vulgaris]
MDYHTELLQSFTFLFWISYSKYRRKQVLILCHISLHAANTGDILCELYEPSTSKEFRSAIYDFTLQHIQNPLIFKVCGFFDLDYTLILYYSFLFFAVKDIINTFMNLQATDMLGIITKFSFIQNSFLYGLIIFAGFTRKKWVKLFLEQLEVSTQRIDELNVSKNYSFLFWYQCIAGIILIFVISGYIITNIFWFSDCNLSIDYSLVLQFYYFETYPSIVMIITDFTFIFWTRYVKINFRQLNTVLQNMLTTTIGSPQHKRVLRIKDNWEDDSSLSTIYRTYKTNENLIKLKRIKYIKMLFGQLNAVLQSMLATTINSPQHKRVLRMKDNWEDDSLLSTIYRTQIHLELIKCAVILNEGYGTQILLSMSSSLIIIVTKSIFNSFIFLYAMNTGDILYELYEPSTSRRFRDEIRDFTFQLVQNRLTFTACGFYDLNHTFIYSIIGSIATYLVILIQAEDRFKVLSNNTNHNSTSVI